MAKAPRPARGAGKSAPKRAPKAARSAPSKTPRAKIAKPRPAAAPKVRGGYEVICSECYSEFDFDSKTSATQLTCPVCMHVGQLPEREDQTRFQIAKGREKKKFLAGLVPGLLFLAVGFAWVYMLNQKGSGEELGPGLNYGLLGATAILFIITVFQGIKYEAARYEVYF